MAKRKTTAMPERDEKLKVYRVAFYVRGHVIIDAASESEAQARAEAMDGRELLRCADETEFDVLGEEESST